MSPSKWKSFLVRYSEDLIKAKKLPVRTPSVARKSGWMGYRPASERAIAAAEARLGVKLPPSLRNFYRVTNGWRAIGFSIYGIRSVEKVAWLNVADPVMHRIASEAEEPIPDEPAHMRDFHFEQGTRVKRSLMISSDGDAAVLLLDPETRDPSDEWAGGIWAAWLPGMEWCATSFAGLIRHERKRFLQLRDNKPIDYGLTPAQAKKKLGAANRQDQMLGVMALQGTNDPRNAEDLLSTYLDESAEGVVREMAIEAACTLKSRQAYEQAIRDLPQSVAASEAGETIDEGGDGVRPYALFGAILAYGEDPASVFAQWLDAPSERLRRFTLASLGHCRRSALAREILIDRLRHPDPTERETAAYALTQFMDKKTVPALTEALSDEVAKVRSMALQGLLHLNATAAVPAIEALARTEEDAHVREKIAFVLPALKSPLSRSQR